jgi:hypothetical protein
VTEDRISLCKAKFLVEWDEKVRLPEISIILRHLVFQDHLIAEGIPCQIGNQAVVLVSVLTEVGEYEVWIELLAHKTTGATREYHRDENPVATPVARG